MTSSQQIFVESFSLSLLAQQIKDPYLFHISVLDSLPSHLLKAPAAFLNQEPVHLLHRKNPPLTPSVSIAVKSHTFHCCKSSQKNGRLPAPTTAPSQPSALILCPFPWTLSPQRLPLPSDPVSPPPAELDWPFHLILSPWEQSSLSCGRCCSFLVLFYLFVCSSSPSLLVLLPICICQNSILCSLYIPLCTCMPPFFFSVM